MRETERAGKFLYKKKTVFKVSEKMLERLIEEEKESWEGGGG